MTNRKNSGQAEDAISKKLKEYYGSVEEEPIPSQLLDLLEKLDEAEEKAQSTKPSKDKGGKS